MTPPPWDCIREEYHADLKGAGYSADDLKLFVMQLPELTEGI